MYSPYLYARNSEIFCLKDDILGNGINLSGLLPILEPVNSRLNTLKSLLTVWNSDAIVILNPYQNDFSQQSNVTILNQELSTFFYSKPNLIKGFLVRSGMSYNDVANLVNSNFQNRIALIFDNPSLSIQEMQALSQSTAVHYHVILNGRIHQAQLSCLPSNKLIVISEDFNKLAKNADYNGVEYFTSDHQFIGRNYLGFGDYTIAGKILELTGGPASAVAAHLIYKEHNRNEIWIKHFVSSVTQRNVSTIEAKFLDVADQITSFVPQYVIDFGSNPGLNHYYRCSQTRHFPQLAKNKQYQMAHHICLMLDVINGRI